MGRCSFFLSEQHHFNPPILGRAFLFFGANTPGPEFRGNSRERGPRSPATGSQGFDPPLGAQAFAEQSGKVCLAGARGGRGRRASAGSGRPFRGAHAAARAAGFAAGAGRHTAGLGAAAGRARGKAARRGLRAADAGAGPRGGKTGAARADAARKAAKRGTRGLSGGARAAGRKKPPLRGGGRGPGGAAAEKSCDLARRV